MRQHRISTPTRLQRALQRQGNISASEAAYLVRNWRRGKANTPGSSAIRHYGGSVKLLWDAIEYRNL